MTTMLHLDDSYLRAFDATVTAVIDEGVVLDRTAFYPTGGGQPHDTGTLAAGGHQWRVVGVSKRGGDVVHALEEGVEPPSVGTAVHGEVDWERRYRLMRTHTALHVLCGVVFREFGALVTGGNMGPDKARMDFELEDLSAERVGHIERVANEVIRDGRAVSWRSLPRAEAFQIPDLIRTKINLLPEAITEVRVVEIDGLDLQADGGTHVRNTREVGGIRVIGTRSKGRINKRLEIELVDDMGGMGGTMNWDRLVARRAPDIHGWLKATPPALERMWQAEGLIYLSNGAPATEQIPIVRLRQAHADAWEEPEDTLSYGDSEGYPPLRREIVRRMAGRGVEVDESQILVTNGSQQGLDLVGRALLDPGDVVVVEGPSYFGAMQAFDAYQVAYRVAPADEHGLIPEALEPLLRQEPRPKLLYTIPTFQNPTGATIPDERRRAILSMTRAANVAVVEDDPYGDIYFTPDPIPPLRAIDPDVIYLGTFSKTLAPALRMGWMVAPEAVLRLARWSKEAVDIMSDRFVQRAVTRTIEGGWLDQHLDDARAFYRERRDALLAALEREMPEGIIWTEPDGGFFLWVTLPEGYSSDDLLSLAVEEGVGFLPGSCFFPVPVPHRGYRLSFPSPDPETIAEGVRRLATATRRLLAG